MDDVGNKQYNRITKKGNLMNDVGDRNCNRITKKGNFDRQYGRQKMQ